MSSKSRATSIHMSLADLTLDGYGGKADIITVRRRSWWRRLLHLPNQFDRTTVYVHAVRDGARVWRY